MSLMAIYRDIKPVSEVAIVANDTRPLSEHLWTYFEFSYDRNFKDDNRLAIPDVGEYEVKTSQNSVHYEHWVSNHSVVGEEYDRLYRIAGFITHVKAMPATVPSQTVPDERLAGAFDASVNTFPTTGGTGVAGAIMEGDIFEVTVAGVVGSLVLPIGAHLRAKFDTPAQLSGRWEVITDPEFIPGQLYVRVTVGRV